jgi:hypothetical protein
MGGQIAWEFRPLLKTDGKPKNGLVGGLSYRYQRMISGDAPDIDRVDASIKHRWWAGDLAFDVGLAYADGTEVKSFADENIYSVAIGFLF